MPDNPKSEAVFAALRQIEGVDEKLLKRPEVAHLPSILDEGELPGCLANFKPVGIVVATDRRIVDIRKSRWGSSIKSVDSYPYSDIQSIEAGESIWEYPLGVQIISSKKRVRIDADKEWRFRFAEYVRARLSTNPIFEAMRGLEGVDDEFLKRPEVLHLPSVLEEGELPVCVGVQGHLSMTVVTDRRIINIKKSMLTDAIAEVKTYPLDEVQWIRAIQGFSGGEGIVLLIDGQSVEIFFDRGSGFALADYVRTRIPPNPAIEALRKLDKVDEEFLQRSVVAYLASVLGEGELPKAVLYASHQTRVLFATDRRIIKIENENFAASIDEVDSYPYADVESVEIRKNVVFKPVWLKVVGREDVSQIGDMKVKKAFVDFVNAKINSL